MLVVHLGFTSANMAHADVLDRALLLDETQTTLLQQTIEQSENISEFTIRVIIEKQSQSVPGFSDLDSYRDQQFAKWRQEVPTLKNPFLLLMDLEAKKLTFAVANGVRGLRGQQIEDVLLDRFIPAARAGEFDQALINTIAALGEVLRDTPIADQPPLQSFDSTFARNTMMHVLYHEMAHALISEFNLPVLANEEAMADSFATLWITQIHTDIAPEIIGDRVRSWKYEDQQSAHRPYDFKREHLLDIRRAYQAACLLYGADPAEWASQVEWLDFSQRDLDDCSDTTPDQIAGWGGVLRPHLLEADQPSSNVSLVYGDGPMKIALQADGILHDFANEMRRFNWPHPVEIHFDHCDQGAFWNSQERRILLCDSYVQRFIKQGEALKNEDYILED
ncbi:hypothetical protein GCM10007939_24470 [Amylibacter marinus]|uniref:TPM domain-containing protein n=2 Tax=Amylibacter marinus TaxID=1475483 RepID=A0ABQ5VYJ9_9RHOB|nr:hypothetical protein GCM10007939_24470 [Amylibacter marinus]